jgi:hypothetical protein
MKKFGVSNNSFFSSLKQYIFVLNIIEVVTFVSPPKSPFASGQQICLMHD